MSTAPPDGDTWYGVRCVFRLRSSAPRVTGARGGRRRSYEERVTVWRAPSFAKAIARAEHEAKTYAAASGARYLGLAQAYRMDGELAEGAEVFSLVRLDKRPRRRYLDRFFDTGRERQAGT